MIIPLYVPEKAVSYSDQKLAIKCRECSSKTHEMVQSQAYLGFGELRLWGLGPRQFKAQCMGCGNLRTLTESQMKKAKQLRYAESRKNTSSKTYPVMDEERREAIRSQNRKEGLLSMGIGIIIGILIMPIPFYSPWPFRVGVGIVIYSILGGLYGIFEDPERRHRYLIDTGKKGYELL